MTTKFKQVHMTPRGYLIAALCESWKRSHPEATWDEARDRSEEYLTHLTPAYVAEMEKMAAPVKTKRRGA